MKNCRLLFIPAIVFCLSAHAQKPVKTYYDYNHQHVKESYYTDSYGNNNGSYTAYSEYGGVLIAGAFKDGKKTGKWVIKGEDGKTVFECNYKEDKLDGHAIEYYENGIRWEGGYADNAKTGEWYSYEPYQTQGDGIYSSPKHTDVPKQALTGCEQVKILMHFNYTINDQDEAGRTKQDQEHYGHFINTFFPSGKKYQEGYYDSYGSLACCYEYFPNGNLAKFYKGDTNEYRGHMARDMKKEWSYPGVSRDSIKMYEEIFNGRVSADQVAYRQQRVEQGRQDSLQQIANRKQQAEQHRNDSLRQAAALKDAADRRRNDSLTAVENRNKIILYRQSFTVDSLYKAFKGTYVVNKQSAFLIDPTTHKPITRNTYPHGEHLYTKSDTLVKTMYRDYKAASGSDTRITKGKDIIALLTKLNALANGDTKDLDKQMKKAETLDDIKKVLGI